MPDPADTPADLTGRTLGDFRLLRRLGKGGMGQVYLARQLSLKREVALKLLRDDLAADPTALRRFQAEAEAVARLSHPNIVQVYAVGEHDGLRFMALEYVEGRNLREYLARKGPPDLPVALAIIRQTAAALQRAGEHGIVHRDVKPENILLTRKAEVKVTDFGLSRLVAGDPQPLNLTQSGVALGTPLYMSPEQVRGRPVDHRSDVYSLGVTCYHLLAGRPPFSGSTAFEVAMQHVQTDPEPLAAARPDLPADLCGMVHKMMAKDPAARYQTPKDILRDLTRIREGISLGLPTPTPPAGTPSGPNGFALSGSGLTGPVAAPPSRWPGRLLAGAGLAALVAAGWVGYDRLHPPAEAAPVGPGLPDADPPEPVVSAAERELLATANSRQAKDAEVVDARIALGLLYVRERRWDDAEKVFKDLEEERPTRVFAPLRNAAGALQHQLAGRFGQAVVLAFRDRAKESVELFQSALQVGPKGAANPAAMVRVQGFLMAHPGFSQAVAEALARNAANLPGQKLPAVLDPLRSPGGVMRGRG